MIMKRLCVLAIMAAVMMSLFAVSIAATGTSVPVTLQELRVNDRAVEDGEVRGDLNRGDTLDVEVKLYATADADNLRVSAELTGYEYSDEESTSDETDLFDVESGKTYYKTLTLELPSDLDLDTYSVRVDVSDRRNERVSTTFTLDVSTARHDVEINDVLFSPGLTVTAGRSLLTSVRVENNGEKDEENVKVTLAVEELGVSDSDYIDELEAEDEKMSEELYVRIPDCAEAGEYAATVTVEYDDGHDETSQDFTVRVLENENCQAASAESKTVITVGPESQNIVAGGSEAVYPVALTNAGSESRTYTVSVTAGDWAATRVSSNMLVVGAGETKVAYAYVKANEDASAGEKLVTIAVKSGDETVKEVSLKANVVSDGSVSWGRGLEVGLVVLVVLLVIVGLIVGFSRLRGNDKESKSEETYY